MKVDVYLNLHRDCVSVRSRESEDYGTVVAHRPKVTVEDVSFVVQPSGRQKCIEEGVKNVHAFVRGKWNDNRRVLMGERVTYNPFEYQQFVHAEDERPVASAEVAMITRKGVFAEGLEYATVK